MAARTTFTQILLGVQRVVKSNSLKSRSNDFLLNRPDRKSRFHLEGSTFGRKRKRSVHRISIFLAVCGWILNEHFCFAQDIICNSTTISGSMERRFPFVVQRTGELLLFEFRENVAFCWQFQQLSLQLVIQLFVTLEQTGRKLNFRKVQHFRGPHA